MEWVKEGKRLPIKSWCAELDEKALEQARNLAAHPATFKHVALMPDAHVGYGMPIGGVIGCRDAVIPNAVGVDIGCGMGALRTNLTVHDFPDMASIRQVLDTVKQQVPVGEGRSHQRKQSWDGFEAYLAERGISESNFTDQSTDWLDKHTWELAHKSLGSLGGGNHFIELQADAEDRIWLMLHSGSRNLGYKIADFYHKTALALNAQWKSDIPDKELAFLPTDSVEGRGYIRDMQFALRFAEENRRRMMQAFKEALTQFFPQVTFHDEVNIHHNYANLEAHFGENVWIHRKGATSAKTGEMGIIPGSMGTSSYIVRGKGHPESFMSCSHGAGRKLGRMAACRELDESACNEAMAGIVFDRWKPVKSWGKKRGPKMVDLGEAPQAYKDIDAVIEAELDLIEPLVKLRPLGVIKG